MSWFTCNVCGEKLYDGSSAICHQDSCTRPQSLDDWADGLVQNVQSIPTVANQEGLGKIIEVLIRGHVNSLKETYE